MNIKTLDEPRLFSPLLCFLAAFVACACSGATSAQEAIFADDFSTDSLSWSTESFDGSGPASARGEPGAIVLEASSVAGGYANRFLSIGAPTDSLSMVASFDPATSVTGDQARATLRIGGNLFNDLADGGELDADGNRYGDVGLSVDLLIDGNGNSNVSVCGNRQGETEFESYPLFLNGDGCSGFNDVPVTPGTRLGIGYAFDRTSGELTVAAGESEQTFILNGPFFAAAFPQPAIEIVAENETPLAVGRVNSITTDAGATDFTDMTPIVDRYRPFFFEQDDLGGADVIDGRARMVAVSDDGDYRSSDLAPARQTDYLEALLTLSSESVIGTGDIDARLESEWFNDTADGGLDGRVGNARSTISIRARADGTRNVEYCLSRSADADFSDSSGLLDDGERCNTFPTRIELDTPYRVSMALDREAQTMTYRFAGFEHLQSIPGGVFDIMELRGDARVSANRGATGVAYIDDLRTGPAALTASERASGLGTPAAFLERADPATLAADSTLGAPYDFQRPLGFVDDFSDPGSRALGFWSGARNGRGEAGVRFVDGAVELQANTAFSDDNDSNYSELYVNGATDLIRARVSLSSDSALPSDSDAEAEITVRAVFHNDVQEGGVDGREGDVTVRVFLRQEGDGRMQAAYSTQRRNAQGDNEDYDIIDGPGFVRFDGFVPALDTVYELALELDRERGLLIVSIDDDRREIALPTQVFQAAQAYAHVQLGHRGSSGRAVGRLHSIQTDTFTRDFADGPGLIGPYAPAFNTRVPGREISVANGRARFVADGTLASGSNTDLFVAGGSDFTGANVELSSESSIAAGGDVRVGVGASLYNDFMPGSGNEGRVFAVLWLVAKADGQNYAEYCAIRSNDADFDDTVELIAGRDDDCARFDLQVALDTVYPISVQLDRADSRLVFRLGTETREYAIPTQILDIGRPFNTASVQTSDGSIAVAYIDDFALSADPVALADSDDRLVTGTGGVNGGPGGDADPDNAGSGDGDAANGAGDGTGDGTGGGGSSGGGGGGCSIARSNAGSGSLAMMLLLAIAGVARRRRRS